MEAVITKTIESYAIVQFKPNAHKIAERNLRQQNFKTFTPLEEIKKYKNGKFITTQRPLFPGYMFVAFEKDIKLWNSIKSTFGVTKVLTHNHKPYLILNTVVTTIMEQCDQNGVFLPKKHFCENDRVRLISSPFENFLATVDSIDEDQRVWILIDLMGQITRALVHAERLTHDNL